mgnify:CR=1 FL=1
MLIGKRLRGGAIAAYLGGPGQVVRSLTHQAERALRRRPPVLDVYLDPGDPWSYLTAQVADRLVRAYGVEPAVHLVTEPASDVSPAPELRSRHAVRDARVVAELWDLAFPGIKEADPKNLAKVSACLVKARPAREQLAVWAERNDERSSALGNRVEIVSQENADPAAVAFDAVSAGKARGRDVVIADTAGRLPTQLHLMEELKKIKRVIAKADAGAPHEVLLVIDGNTGQNALTQVKAFDDALGLTGLIVTKLDGTAKGGVLAAIARERPVPVYFIGVGEKLEDLQTFSAREFAQALLS